MARDIEDVYTSFDTALDTKVEDKKPAPLSVTAVLSMAKKALAGVLTVTVTGEVSGFTGPNRSGHYYFDIKEKVFNEKRGKYVYNTLPLTVYKWEYERYNLQLKDGDQIVCRGKLDIWFEGGKFSFRPDHIEYAGEGVLLKKYEEVEKRLRAQGIFDLPKKPIPEYCERVIMVTSASGEVRYDVANNINPLVKLGIVDAQIQGAGAAESIAKGIKLADTFCPDAIIIGRGGGQAGTLGDFLPFFEEEVVLAIAHCNAPVISSLGHHRNNPLANLVADLVCSTPSIAAKAVFPTVESLVELNNSSYKRLTSSMAATLNNAKNQTSTSGRLMLQKVEGTLGREHEKLNAFKTRPCLQSPMYVVDAPRAELDKCSKRLIDAMSASLQERSQSLEAAQQRMNYAASLIIPTGRQHLKSMAQQLDALSPLKVMLRGYAVARDSKGHAITSVSQVVPGQEVNVLLSEGSFNAQVTTTNVQ